MTVIDVHTHMLDREWLRLLRDHGAPRYGVGPIAEGLEGIYRDGALFMTPMPGHFDYDLRLADMDAAGVDLAIVSLTCPNVYWGGADVSLRAARVVNDSMAAAQTAYPERIRFLASLPWEYPAQAVDELARACDAGAVGVMVMANVAGRHLTEDAFGPIWQAIDDRALPVLVHPSEPPGTPDMDMTKYSLASTVGFMFDTTLAITRMIFSGFLDRYPKLKIIASHAGATLPYLAGRLDRSWQMTIPGREAISIPPSDYLRRIWYDAVTYNQGSLELCIEVGGADKVLYGLGLPARHRRHGRLPGARRRPAGRDARRRPRNQRAGDLRPLGGAHEFTTRRHRDRRGRRHRRGLRARTSGARPRPGADVARRLGRRRRRGARRHGRPGLGHREPRSRAARRDGHGDAWADRRGGQQYRPRDRLEQPAGRSFDADAESHLLDI